MKNRITLFKAYSSMLFFDSLMWVFTRDRWQEIRKTSNQIYKVLKVMYK